MTEEKTHVNLTHVGYPNSVFDGGNLRMLDPVKFVNYTIVNLCSKYLIENFHCHNNFMYSNYRFIRIFEQDGDLNNVNLGMEAQNAMFTPVNVTRLDYKSMVIVIAEEDRKETEVFSLTPS